MDTVLLTGWIGRIAFVVSVLLQIAIAILIVIAFRDQQWLVTFSGAAILMLTFVPAIIERKLRVQLPVELTFVTCIFLYACFALGDVRAFYDRYWWWDLMLHGFSAFVTGLIGFLALYVLYMTNRFRVAPIYVGVITFSLAVSVGTLWEIFEFLADWFLATNLQQSGLVDTMTDLMINMAGALLAALIGYCYVLEGDSFLGERFVRRLLLRYMARVEKANTAKGP